MKVTKLDGSLDSCALGPMHLLFEKFDQSMICVSQDTLYYIEFVELVMFRIAA